MQWQSHNFLVIIILASDTFAWSWAFLTVSVTCALVRIAAPLCTMANWLLTLLNWFFRVRLTTIWDLILRGFVNRLRLIDGRLSVLVVANLIVRAIRLSSMPIILGFTANMLSVIGWVLNQIRLFLRLLFRLFFWRLL